MLFPEAVNHKARSLNEKHFFEWKYSKVQTIEAHTVLFTAAVVKAALH